MWVPVKGIVWHVQQTGLFLIPIRQIFIVTIISRSPLFLFVSCMSEFQRSLLSIVIPERRCSDIWSILAPFRMRSKGKGDNSCFCQVAIVIDLVLIGLMIIWLLSHQLDTWSELSCIVLLICRISFPDVCSVVLSACMSQSTDTFFTCNGRSLIKRLKRIGPKTEPVVHYTLLILWRSKSHGVSHCVLLWRYDF